MSEALLEVRALRKHFPMPGGLFSRAEPLRAVDGVDLDVRQGEIVGLVGESGSGKTTLGRSILRLIEPSSGSVRFGGRDVLALGGREMRRLRRRMQIVFQDPGSSLNPRMKVRSLVGEPLSIHGIARGKELTREVGKLLEEVGLEASAMSRYPHEFSGGQRQRIAIARAIGIRPDFVVCDEPVAALDVSVQAQIINLLVRLQRAHGMAYLFVAHDLALVGHLCDRIAVLYLGKVVEEGPRESLLESPEHPYTRALFAASPPPDPARARQLRAPIPGEMPSASARPSGCAFRTRCPHAEDRCAQIEPELSEIRPGVRVACHRVGQIGPFTDPGATNHPRAPLSKDVDPGVTGAGGAARVD